MRLLFLFISVFSVSTYANDELIESIEKFTDIFGLSFSQANGETIATVDANYYITDELRVFGDIDTQMYWEVGAGYSFWSGETYYTENNIKVSDRKISTGIFAATAVHEKWTLIGDVAYNHNFDATKCLANTCVDLLNADTLEYSAGFIWSPIKYIDWIYKFNHEFSYQDNEFEFTGIPDVPFNSGKTNITYHELVTVLNLKYIRPTITYTYSEYFPSSFEFGFSFDF